jgi:hypothetical protein
MLVPNRGSNDAVHYIDVHTWAGEKGGSKEHLPHIPDLHL